MKCKLREARVTDLRSIIGLLNLLHKKEAEFTESPLIENEAERHELILHEMARQIVNPNSKVLVIDKSGRLVGLHIAVIEYLEPIFKNSQICHWRVAYARKSDISIRTVEKEIRQWAKEKGCKTIRVATLYNNDKIHKLMEIGNYEPKHVIYEKEI